MFARFDRVVSAGIVLIVVLIAVGQGLYERLGQSRQLPCTVTVGVGSDVSIQKVVDTATAGAVICLTKGVWKESIKLDKTLTLRGLGKDPQGNWLSSIVQDPRGFCLFQDPNIRIQSDFPIEVTVEGVSIAQGPCFVDGIWVAGTAKASLRTIQSVHNEGAGLHVIDSAQVTISDAQITENGKKKDNPKNSGGWGILVEDSARVTGMNLQIMGNLNGGIALRKMAQAEIAASSLTGNDNGIVLEDTTQAKITDSQLTGNKNDGVAMSKSTQLTLSKSTVSGSIDGVRGVDSAQIIITGSTISGNQQGLFISQSTAVTLSKSQISSNNNYGVVSSDSGQLTISDSTVSANKTNVGLLGSTHAQISGSTISGGSFGLLLQNSAQATVSNSMFSGPETGISAEDASQLTIAGSTISSSGNGIVLKASTLPTSSGNVLANISDNRITGNKGYGVALYQKPCFPIDAKFGGTVNGSNNEMKDNKSGNLCPQYPGPTWPPHFIKGT